MIIEIISKLLVLVRNSDWLVALLKLVKVISTVIRNWLYNDICFI